MAEQPTPMTDADIVPPASAPHTVPPVKDSGPVSQTTDTAASKARAQIKEQAGKAGQQASDKLRLVARDGKVKTDNALDQLTQMMRDAAGNVDEKLGSQYGQYAHQAAGGVDKFAEKIKSKDVDELFDEARALIAKSPAAAAGIAAAIGFVLARVAQSGIETAKSE